MTQRPEAPTDAVFTAARTSDPVASIHRVADAYGSPEVDIEGILGAEISPDDPDRAVIEPWAATVDGPILDVGAGTGRWTGHLARLGHTVEGLEPSDRLITIARARHPAVVFHHDSIEDLAHCATRRGGILAWYSMIHMSAEELPHALAVLRARLHDGGSLLMSFFAGPRLEAFDHPIAAAYRWPMNKTAEALTQAGFELIVQHSNPRSPHAYITACAAPGCS
ncbi:MAG: class I SAM-dependent methyltransferase [Candidatus Leucobacter sulfamidivorax]|nr:class I SAM-dependent methyltransferase [Candidatus Leucobacter sulfamidivorax]